MRITLHIENVDRLETGGQVSYSCADRGFDIGRHEHLDWSLPDPQRVISGKHCEVRFEGGQFVLYDLSTNGTFMNGNLNRMDKPQDLRSGDRFMIGDYIISVALDAADALGHGGAEARTTQPEQWSAPFETPQPPSAPPNAGWQASEPQTQDPSYPLPESQSPWGAPQTGMEGRHAPPSETPGIGTPADDVWGQQGHSWGSADPDLYNPQSQPPIQLPPQPAQADPLDHLAPQADLQRADFGPADRSGHAELPMRAGGELQVPTPSQDNGPGSLGAPQSPPLFGMPDLGTPDPGSPSAEDAVSHEAVIGTVPQDIAQDLPDEHVAVSPLESQPDDFSAAPSQDPGLERPPEADTLPVASTEPPMRHPPAVPVDPPSVETAEPEPTPGVVTGSADVLRAFAEGAGIDVSTVEDRDPVEFTRELGTILKGITGDLMGLLAARNQVKSMTRNANRTMIGRSGNNALKFSPTPQMALQTMLSKNAEANGYLPISRAMSGAFKDIQKHHVWTYAAMQKAAARFENTLSPKAIQSEGQVQKSTFGNKNAKLWEKLDERWSSLTGAHDDGLVGVFTQYFTENYEELSDADSGEGAGSIE